jgi:transcriptional pleiotropic regulator of transition state genes
MYNKTRRMRNMTDTGVVRKLDELGRITLPMELRKHLHMEDRESLHIYVDGEKIILEKYSPSDVFTGEADNLIEFHGKKVSKNSIKQLAELAGFKIDN